MTNRATVCERCGSGLLDGKHIASYPPCNGEDATRNRVEQVAHSAANRDPLVTPTTPLRCDRCGGEWTVAQAEVRPYSCPNNCYMGPRWQTLDCVPYFTKSSQVYP